jgi:DNA-binding transcriptional regulator GbsR (MarR family)
MKAEDSIVHEFREIVYESCKAIGLDDLPSRLISVLQSEKEGISLGELAEITGYSLSNLSTTIKGMEDNQMVKKFKKPRSRKIFVVMDKDITSFFIELQKKRYQQSLKPSLKKIPEIIRRYEGNDKYQDELVIIKNYYQQTLIIAEETKKFIKALENLEKNNK